MAEIIRFPASRRIPATAIPRERFEELAQLSLDLVDQIVALLNATEENDETPERGSCHVRRIDVTTTE